MRNCFNNRESGRDRHENLKKLKRTPTQIEYHPLIIVNFISNFMFKLIYSFTPPDILVNYPSARLHKSTVNLKSMVVTSCVPSVNTRKGKQKPNENIKMHLKK